MSHGRITHYSGARYRITAHMETTLLKSEPVYAAWTNYASQRSVRAIALASQSCQVWIATWGGVLLLDRQVKLQYQRFSSEHGLASNAVACICVDREEHPWAGHVEGGVSYFDGKRWLVYEYLQREPIRVVGPAVSCGGIWAASADMVYYIAGLDHPPQAVVAPRRHDGTVEALALCDTGSEILLGNAWGLYRLALHEEPVLLKEITCTALVQDHTKGVWVGTSEGVYRLDDQELVGPVASADAPQSMERVLSLAVGRDRLWILTPTGLAQVMDEHWQAIPGPAESRSLYAIAASPDETYLWVGTDHLLASAHYQGYSQLIWDLDWLPLQKEEALSNVGRCVATQMLNDRVWVGTAGGLVSFGPDDEWTMYADCGDVRALSIADMELSLVKVLWVAVWPRGVGRWAHPNWLDFRGAQPPGIPLLCAVGQDQNLHVLTSRGLWQLAGNTPRYVGPMAPPAAQSLAQTVDGQWWLGTLHGIYRLTARGWEIPDGQPGPSRLGVRTLTVVENRLWVATEKGLWVYHEGLWKQCNAEPNDTLSDVSALAPSSNPGEFWLARETGIARYSSSTKRLVASYNPINSGLGSYRVVAMAEINKSLWVVTQVGISRFKLD